MMRSFVRLETIDGQETVTATLESLKVPGNGPDLPPGYVETTGRSDNPDALWTYDRASDTFSPPAPILPTADEIEADRLIDKDPTTYTQGDINKLNRLLLKKGR